MANFNSLPIGSTFDFVGPDRHNSFFDRCEKISRTKYKSTVSGLEYRVGSRMAQVFHVVTPADEPAPLPFAARLSKVFQGSDVMAICKSNSFAVRVAAALNQYIPPKRGR